MRFLAFIGSAALVALIALAGHWMTDSPPTAAAPAPVVTQQTAPATGGTAGDYWPVFAVMTVTVMAGTMGFVAWRRQRAIPSFDEPAEIGPDPDWPQRWHCILYINGYQAGRDYVEFPAPDNQVMERELVQRFLDRHGSDLPAGVRVTARATPATAERVA